MLIRKAPRFKTSDITDPNLHLSRRAFMAGAAALALLPAAGASEAGAATPSGQPLTATRDPAYSIADPVTKFESATTYNNFYEFGVEKDDPSRLAHTLKPRPWAVKVDGLVGKPKTFDIDDLSLPF